MVSLAKGGGGTLSGSNGTSPRPRGRRRALPQGWRLIDGGKGPPTEYDPILDQSRELARMLFSACLVGTEIAWSRSGARARASWLEYALLRRDASLCEIIERVDGEAFDEVWSGLVRRMDARGAPDVVAWLAKRWAGAVR